MNHTPLHCITCCFQFQFHVSGTGTRVFMFSVFYSCSHQNVFWQYFFFLATWLYQVFQRIQCSCRRNNYTHISPSPKILIILNKHSNITGMKKFRNKFNWLFWLLMALTQLLDQNGWACWRTVPSTSPNSTVAVGLPRSGCLKVWGIGLAKCFERLLKRTHNMNIYEV